MLVAHHTTAADHAQGESFNRPLESIIVSDGQQINSLSRELDNSIDTYNPDSNDRYGRSMRVRNLQVASAPPPQQSTPESRLWSSILLQIYKEVSLGGINSKAYRESLVNLDAMNWVMDCLGYLDSDAFGKLLDRAVLEFELAKG